MNDIRTKEDIRLLVESFYKIATEDPIIGPVFSKHVKEEEWPNHIDRITDFWNSAIFLTREYIGNPFAKHIPLDLDAQHFQQWLEIFNQTIDDNFKGDIADDIKTRASKMGMMFQAKLKYLKDNDNLTPIM